MIYDKIENIEIYKGLSDEIYEGLRFLKQAPDSVEVGVYEISPKFKAIVSEYETKYINENGYEAHRQYIDIQAVLSGEEHVFCLPIDKLSEIKPYRADIDAAFYATDKTPLEMEIGNGYFAIFHPQDGHMPQLCADKPLKVKKVVIKVSIDE